VKFKISFLVLKKSPNLLPKKEEEEEEVPHPPNLSQTISSPKVNA